MRRLTLVVAFCAISPGVAVAQVREALIVFKDGFSIKGKAIQKKDFIIDPVSGQSFVIPKDGSFLYVDDDVRRIHFSQYQVQEVIPSKAGETRKDLITIRKQNPSLRKNRILMGWSFENFTDWNDKWERSITVKTPTGQFDMRQRIILLTPWQTFIMNVQYAYDQQFLTKEMGAEFVLGLLHKHYANQKELKEVDKRLLIARFMYQAGWYGVALHELEKLVKELPEAKENADPLIQQLKQMRANLIVDDIERSNRIGQHDEAQNRIAAYFKEDLGKEASEKHQILALELKTKYEAANEKLRQAKHALKELPAKLPAATRTFWGVVAALIQDELSIDTLPRLDTFLTYAQQHLRDLEAKSKPAQATEAVLAIAISGWLQGNSLAEPDVKTATKLFRARLMLQEYLKTEGGAARQQLISTFSRENDLPIDMMARLIRQMPPITPFEKTTVQDQHSLQIEVPESSGGDYLVQLPPDYNHQRTYPVVVLLQSSREKASVMMDRWREMAAHHGYVLAAPLWGGKGAKQIEYKYSAKEHDIALDCIRDLRRRFNVDSDRVFLFGWEDGGTMAFDVGLAHPDQFAGVLPKNGSCDKFPSRCWSNGQYLPFYVVEGENNGGNPKRNLALFKDWIRGNYPSIMVEYKGRASEWYAWELPTMFEWMNKKKRHQSARELGRYHTAGGSGEEFKTLRESDNKFYWLSTSKIDERFLTDAASFNLSTRPATLQANIAVGNEGDGKNAKIWNQINVRSTGIKQVSIWLAPHMIDFTKPVSVRVNAAQYGKQSIIAPSLGTMLEEYFQSGDKQRLYYAKIDVKL